MTETVTVTFGRWLRQRRRSLDLTQDELADRVGYAVTTIRRIEADDLRPSKELADKLATALNVLPDERPRFLHLARGATVGDPLPSVATQTHSPAAPIRPHHNLPVQLSSFIGRQREIDALLSLLGASRLVTLTGVGGTGKTRLALEVARKIEDRGWKIEDRTQAELSSILYSQFSDGVWLVELAPLMDPALLPQVVATALTIHDEAGRPLVATLTDYLHEKRLLLILDNCEHLIEACAQLVDALLRACPNLHILATGREALGLTGETIFQVPSLSLPNRDITDPDQLSQSEAVRLFVERARAVQPGFVVTTETTPALIQICRTLDGIPLALELAAARVRTLPLAQMAARIEDRFRLLTGGSRTALSRHRTLQGLIDWSYGLLTEAERTLLQRLSVFAGGWTLEAAEAVCSSQKVEGGRRKAEGSQQTHLTSGYWLLTSDILDLLTRLVEKSLALVESQGAEGRYRLLETIRQYAREKLVEAGAAEMVQDRHLAYFVALAEEGEVKLRGPEQMAWFKRLATEHDNLRAALAWSQARLDGGEAGLRLVGALWSFWKEQGYITEGRRWLNETLTHPGAAGRSAARASALTASYAMMDAGEMDVIQKHLLEAEAIWREVGDQRGLAWTLRCRSFLAYLQADIETARELSQASAVLFRAIDDSWGLAWTYLDQGDFDFTTTERYTTARSLLETSVALFEAVGDPLRCATSLSHLAFVDVYEGYLAIAQARTEERLAVERILGHRHGLIAPLAMLALVAARQGQHSRATALYDEAYTLLRDIGQGVATSWLGVVGGFLALYRGDHAHAEEIFRTHETTGIWLTYILAGLGGVALQRGHLTRAATLLGAVAGQRQAGITRVLFTQYEYEQFCVEVRHRLSPAEFATAWAAGEAMTREQAIAYALENNSVG